MFCLIWVVCLILIEYRYKWWWWLLWLLEYFIFINVFCLFLFWLLSVSVVWNGGIFKFIVVWLICVYRRLCILMCVLLCVLLVFSIGIRWIVMFLVVGSVIGFLFGMVLVCICVWVVLGLNRFIFRVVCLFLFV